MTGNGPELAMVALVFIILILIFAIVWFVFMLPMEKGLHNRRMELIQRKLKQNEERLERARRASQDGAERLCDGDGNARD